MNNVVCQYCKHSINEHDGSGCHRKIAGGICDCNHSPNYIAAQPTELCAGHPEGAIANKGICQTCGHCRYVHSALTDKWNFCPGCGVDLQMEFRNEWK